MLLTYVIKNYISVKVFTGGAPFSMGKITGFEYARMNEFDKKYPVKDISWIDYRAIWNRWLNSRNKWTLGSRSPLRALGGPHSWQPPENQQGTVKDGGAGSPTPRMSKRNLYRKGYWPENLARKRRKPVASACARHRSRGATAAAAGEGKRRPQPHAAHITCATATERREMILQHLNQHASSR